MDVHDIGILGDGDETINEPIIPTRDEDYYFQNVIFLVGNTLFRLPKNLFNKRGTAFESMFSVPVPPATEPEGSSDDNPIVLNVDENKFRGFLRVICRSINKPQKLTNEDWLGALDLATMWNFDVIRRKAIQALDGWSKSQSLKQVILTAKQYDIDTWLKFAYTQLVLNPHEAFPLDELTNHPVVDWETIAKLIHIKYQLAMAVHECSTLSRYRDRCEPQSCRGIVGPLVEEMFKGE